MKKRLTFILALALMLMLTVAFGSVSTAFAADDDGYDYVIKVYSGTKGTYQREKTQKKKYGDSVTIDVDDVKVTDDRYYARGFRIAGHDNDEMEGENITGFTRMTFDVTEDINYEVAYGIKGAMVPYTIRYVDDATGAAISGMAEDTYYGMPGDKPVVSFKYIEGYQPQTYSLSRTLTDDASQNVFEFRYAAAAAGETTTTTTTVTRTVAAPAAPGTAANPAGTNTGAPAANAAANANAGTSNIGDNDTPLAEGPQQYADLDDGKTPLADGSSEGGAGALPILIGCAAGVLILLALLLYLLRKRRQEEDEEDDGDPVAVGK